MRILHVIGSFLPVKGGGPYYVHHLSRHLERLGHECLVVTTDVTGTEPTIETVETRRATAKTVAGLPVAPSFPLELRRAIRSFDPDVVHGNYPLPLYPDVAALAARRYDVPYVLTAHGALEMDLGSFIGAFGAIYNRTQLQGTLGLSDRIHVSNGAMLDHIDVLGRHRKKTTVVPIGVDTEWFDPQVVSGEPPYTARDDESVVLFVGAFRRYKGLSYLVDAFAQLEEEQTRLVLVGDGSERDRVEQLVVRHDIEGSVELVGHVKDATLRRAYAHADVFVLPSPDISESYGMVVLEALSMGVPVVVTEGSGIGTVLRSRSYGRVVEPRSATALAEGIRRTLADRNRRTSQEYNVQIAADFGWVGTAEEYVSLYRSVL